MPCSSAPVLVNTCTDVNNSESINTQIKSFCTPNAFGPEDTITSFCNSYGGTTAPGSGNIPGGNPNAPFPDPEWGFGKLGSYGDCDYDDTESGYLWTKGSGCGCGACPITGIFGYCTRRMNSGDPLICALRDYQCNGDNKISDASCFSDNNLNSTCSKDFRAPDTLPSNFLLNQLCLNNINGAFQSFGSNSDFLQLWVNNNNESTGQNWIINGLPSGTKYRTSQNIEAVNTCKYDQTGNITNNCPTTEWAVGQPNAPDTYLPSPDTYIFNGAPPCQQILWRTLYGNQPTFQNNYYAPFGIESNCPDGSNICDNTSVPPQQAACAALPFQGTPTPVGLQNAKFLLTNAVKKYYANGGNLLATNTQINPAFQDFVFNICSAYPSLCSEFIQDTVCSGIDKTNIAQDLETMQWCGCNMNTEVYAEYADNFGISRQCTPYCNIPKVIPYVNPDTNNALYCDQSICMIDNVTLTLAKTRFLSEGVNGGNINFTQICNSCSSSNTNGTGSNTVTNSNSTNTNTNYQENNNGFATINCQCILNNFTLTTIGATIEGGVNISQACNGNAKCYSNGSNLDGSALEVNCNGSSTSQNDVIAKAKAELLKKANTTSNYWVILVFVIFVGLIIIAWLLIAPRGVPETDLIYSKRFDIPKPQVQMNPYNQNFFIGNLNKPKTKFY
jgi:hypothetical protein